MTKWTTVHQNFLVDATSQTPNQAKFVAISKKNARGPQFTKNFRRCYPLIPPIIPSFIEIGQTSLEMGGVNCVSDKKIYFVTDGQKRDYLSRASQCVRGATKN